MQHIAHSQRGANGFVVRFDTATGRRYYVYYNNTGLMNQAWSNATPAGINGTGAMYEWTDDGSQTTPHPSLVTNRLYKIGVSLP